MSRKNRERRGERRGEKSPPQEQPSMPFGINRRTLLATGGIAAGTAVLYGLYEGYQKIQDTLHPSRKLYPAAINAAGRRGTVVFDQENGTPECLFLCFKQLHGGATTVDEMRHDPKRLELFTKHQDGLRSALQEQLEQTEVGNIHFFFEGFVGEKETWGKDQDQVLKQVAQIDEMLRDPPKRQIVLQMIAQMLQRPTEGTGALYLLNGAGRFAAYCEQKKYPVIHGADPPNHPPLTKTMHDAFESLVKKDNPTDAEIEETIRQINAATENDEKVRHAYITHQLQTYVPKEGVGIVVAGASHFDAGVNYNEGRPSNPLETELVSIPHGRTVIVDESHLPQLLITRPNTLVLGRSMKPEQVRLYLKILKARN